MPKHSVDNLENVFYSVEADSFATQVLWENWAKGAEDINGKRFSRVEWESISSGRMVEVCYMEQGTRPVMLSLWMAIIEGREVLFYQSSSQVVDWVAIEKWLEANVPSFKKRHTDAMNFHNAVHAIRRENEE